MAIFLLIYIVIILIFWVTWAGALTFLIMKHRLPDNRGIVVLSIFLGVSIIIFLVSIIFLARADWVTVPGFMKFLGA
jgi:hypothetical protein